MAGKKSHDGSSYGRTWNKPRRRWGVALGRMFSYSVLTSIGLFKRATRKDVFFRRTNGPSKYKPHQGQRETDRRVRQMKDWQLTGWHQDARGNIVYVQGR